MPATLGVGLAYSEPMTLPTFDDDDVRRVLCVLAHPDDAEYGLSAAVNRWTGRGVDVSYLLLTAGEAGMQRHPDEVGPLRAREQRAACDIVGVEDLEILDHPDGALVYSLELRRDVARKIRQFRPDVVITNTWQVEVPWGLNHADHRVAGLVTVDACRDADNPWAFPELNDAGLEKWHASKLLVYGAEPTHGIPLRRDDVDAAVASLEAHAQYLADLPDHPAPDQFLPEVLGEHGKALGHDYGFAFSVHEL
jgi:LmbE family N-acetylglucosaminyl deacetylase